MYVSLMQKRMMDILPVISICILTVVKVSETTKYCVQTTCQARTAIISGFASVADMIIGTSIYYYTACNCTMCNLLLLGKSHFFWE